MLLQSLYWICLGETKYRGKWYRRWYTATDADI